MLSIINILIKQNISVAQIFKQKNQMDAQKQKQQQQQKQAQNKILRKCLKTLLHRLLHQYKSQSYDSNGIMIQYFIQLQTHNKQYKQKKNQQIMTQIIKLGIKQNVHNERQTQRQSQSIYSYWSQEDYSQVVTLWPEISVFVWQLARSAKWYVEMLRNQEIYAEESQCIDMHVFTTKIYKRVMAQASKMTKYTKLFQQICADQIFFFLEQVSAQICYFFKSGQKIVVNQLNYVTSVVSKSQIVTFYLLYKIFKDTALVCRHRIISQLQQGIFRNIQPQVLDNFAHYIIQKYQVLDMKMDSEKKTEQKIPITEKIMNCNHVKWRQAIRQDGQIGIFVELQNQDQEGKSVNYMLMFDENDEISVVNTNSISRQWKVCKKAEQNHDILQLVKSKKSLAQKMRTTSTKAPIQMTLLQNVGVLGGSMGKCLAQIDTYDNIGQFMVSLSKRTIIGGSFNYLLMSVPLLGYIFVTGGFTYTFYYIFSNQYANSDKKLRQLRNITIGSATSLGSGLVGAAIGQTLIPVPMLGAFIGGLVGGFIGQFGSRMLSTAMQTARFKEVIQQLKNTIQPKGYWQVNQRTLDVLSIKRQKFYETIPQKLQNKLNCNKIWLTLLFFTILCFHQSRQRIKTMERTMKDQKKLQRKLSDYQIIQANQNMSGRKQYQPSIDFMCVMHYFDDHQIIFIEFHEQIAFLLNKVFSKIK